VRGDVFALPRVGFRVSVFFHASHGLGTTNYLYDGANILETTDQNGNELARYADTPNIDEPLSELVSGTTSFYEQDGLGSVTSLTGGSGALANTYTYGSYGALTASTGTLTDPFQYAGREFDSETSLYYYRARYYNPAIGRFVSGDPAGLLGGINLYAYATNKPLRWIDPFGFCATPWERLHLVGEGLFNLALGLGKFGIGTGAAAAAPETGE
jgi:RHS repeat-associated protein